MFEWSNFGFWARQVVASFIQLPTSLIVVSFVGLALLRSRRRLGALLIGLATTALLAFSLPIVANALAAHDEAAYPPLPTSIELPAHAAIVVLGGGLELGAIDQGGETVNPITLVRLRSAAALARRTQRPILVTGGRLVPAQHSEGELMARSLANDFQTSVTWIEDQSIDTAGNARLSVPILKSAGIELAVLVTDASHMHRARAAFERAGIAVLCAPTAYYANGPTTVFSFVPNTNALRRSNWMLHEWLGSLWMRMTT